MRTHHRQVVDRLVELFGNDPRFVALIIGGSIARGWDREDSDVDIVLVATHSEYARRAATGAFHYWNPDLCDYPGGYVDGKIVDRQYLEEVRDRGNEPSRAAFVGAIVAFSHDPDIAGLVEQIGRYPEAGRREKIASFYAQMEALRWYMGEADKRQDRYLAAHVAADLVLFGGRMILAHNRILYPYHKWFMRVLQEAPLRPADLQERLAGPVHA